VFVPPDVGCLLPTVTGLVPSTGFLPSVGVLMVPTGFAPVSFTPGPFTPGPLLKVVCLHPLLVQSKSLHWPVPLEQMVHPVWPPPDFDLLAQTLLTVPAETGFTVTLLASPMTRLAAAKATAKTTNLRI
jgi:hypothetical protein